MKEVARPPPPTVAADRRSGAPVQKQPTPPAPLVPAPAVVAAPAPPVAAAAAPANKGKGGMLTLALKNATLKAHPADTPPAASPRKVVGRLFFVVC